MELFGIWAGFFALGQVVAWSAVSVLYPAFWIWMLVDSILRDQSEYPGGGGNTKVVWIVLLAFFQIVAVVYFFMVYAKIKRSPRKQGDIRAQAPQSPAHPTVAPG